MNRLKSATKETKGYMIRILLSTRLGERRMTQSDLARVTGIRSQTINELYHDFAERVNLDDLDHI